MSQMILAGVIFLVSLAAIMTEKVNRTTAAISGMVLLLAFRIVNLEQAISTLSACWWA